MKLLLSRNFAGSLKKGNGSGKRSCSRTGGSNNRRTEAMLHLVLLSTTQLSDPASDHGHPPSKTTPTPGVQTMVKAGAIEMNRQIVLLLPRNVFKSRAHPDRRLKIALPLKGRLPGYQDADPAPNVEDRTWIGNTPTIKATRIPTGDLPKPTTSTFSNIRWGNLHERRWRNAWQLIMRPRKELHLWERTKQPHLATRTIR